MDGDNLAINNMNLGETFNLMNTTGPSEELPNPQSLALSRRYKTTMLLVAWLQC
jgi:hypothetical protein